MSDKNDLMAFSLSRAMTGAAWRILGSMERLLIEHYASKEGSAASAADTARRQRFKHRLGVPEVRCQTNIEAIAASAHEVASPRPTGEPRSFLDEDGMARLIDHTSISAPRSCRRFGVRCGRVRGVDREPLPSIRCAPAPSSRNLVAAPNNLARLQYED